MPNGNTNRKAIRQFRPDIPHKYEGKVDWQLEIRVLLFRSLRKTPVHKICTVFAYVILHFMV